MLAAGAPLARQLPGRFGLELRLIVLGGETILRKAAQSGAMFRQRPLCRRVIGCIWAGALCANAECYPQRQAPFSIAHKTSAARLTRRCGRNSTNKYSKAAQQRQKGFVSGAMKTHARMPTQ